MIAFDQVVSPLSVDVPNAVEVGIISVIDLADHTPADVGFVSADRHRPVEPHTLNRFVEKGFWQPWHPAGPSDDRRPIDLHAALAQQINDILVGQRIAQVPTYRAKDDVSRGAVVLERGSTRHA